MSKYKISTYDEFKNFGNENVYNLRFFYIKICLEGMKRRKIGLNLTTLPTQQMLQQRMRHAVINQMKTQW